MKVLVVSQYFWPENFRINELVEDLVRRGYEVTVLTGLPNYPGGCFFDGYGWQRPGPERVLGARIVRAGLIPRGEGGAFRLAANYFSFVLTGCWAVLWRLSGPFDAIFVCQLSPVTSALPAVLAKLKFRAPILMWVLDLWPESLAATGMVRRKWLLELVGKLVGFIYRHCHGILVQSRAFEAGVLKRGGKQGQIRYLPNWIEREYEEMSLAPSNMQNPDPDVGGFVILYGGNIGAAQDFEAVIEAMERLARTRPEVRWVLAGEGRQAAWLRAEIERRNLGNVVSMLGQRPSEEMPGLFAKADALFVSLRSADIFAMTVPGKVQSYLAAGKPILGMINGEAARVINESGGGIAVPAGDHEALVCAVVELLSMPASGRYEMGERGRRYAIEEFGRSRLLDRVDSWLTEAGNAASRP